MSASGKNLNPDLDGTYLHLIAPSHTIVDFKYVPQFWMVEAWWANLSLIADYNERRLSQAHVSLGQYDATPSLREPVYLAYPQAGYADHPVQPSPMTYDRQADQMPYAASSFREPRASYEVTQPPTADTEDRKLPQIISLNPDRGPQGSRIYVYISTTYDLLYYPLTIGLMFASRLCTPIVNRLEPQGSQYNYQLTAEVPPHSSTSWLSSMVPLSLQLQHSSKADIESLHVGTFTYTTGAERQTQASPADGSRKRKISQESLDSRIPTKRSSNQHLQSSNQSYTERPYTGQNRLYSYQQPSPTSYAYGTPRSYGTTYERQDEYRRSTQSGSERSMYSTSGVPSQASAWSSSYVGQSARSPALTGSTPRIPSLSSTSSSIRPGSSASNPPLIRTSTIQPPNSPAGQAATAGNGIYPYGFKAVLKINGDLDSMADDWSTEEWTAKRRLVQFFTAQNGNTIDAQFQAAPPEQGAPKGGICISCIWWAERQECYVTSVDTIYLLEALVGVRFGVEEKNRIRRNLEGFRPTTVSKGKSDSEDFFKVIMDFPNPKPRNIEKDVKVFPWKILAHALKKIIGKYVSLDKPSDEPREGTDMHPVRKLLLPNQHTPHLTKLNVRKSPARNSARTTAATTAKNHLPSLDLQLHIIKQLRR